MQALLALESAISTGQVITLQDTGITYSQIGIFTGVSVIACGVVLGMLLSIVGTIFGTRVGTGGGFFAMALFALAVCGAMFGLLYLGQVTTDDISAAAAYGQYALPMFLGFKVFLISLAAGFVILVLVISAIARDAQGDRAALGAVLFVSILMLAAGAVAFYGITYAWVQFILPKLA